MAMSEATKVRGKCSGSFKVVVASATLTLVAGLPGMTEVASSKTFIGTTQSFTGASVCSSPTGTGNTWTCRVPNEDGGFATISGISTSGFGPDFTQLNNLIAANLGKDAILIGDVDTKATREKSIAIGQGAKATGSGGIAIGSVVVDNPEKPGQASEAVGADSIAIGSGAIADAGVVASGAVALGKQAKAMGSNSLAVGSNATAEEGTAIGAGAKALNGGLAVGLAADAGPGSFFPSSSVALGDNAKIISGSFNVALGAMSVAGDSDLSAPGYRPTSSSVIAGESPIGEVSVGGDSCGGDDVYRRITNLAAGAADTDAVNVSQLKAAQQAIVGDASIDFSGDNYIAGDGDTFVNQKVW